VRLAIIDCGTNTFNMLIVDTKSDGSYTRVHNTRIPVKLGENAINKGFIAPAPFERGINALVTFNLLIKEHEVEKVLALATSAIRDASNCEEFVNAAKTRGGIDIEVIDGDREAELIYLGNREAVDLGNTVSLIMDIGGGSTEYILATKDEILWKRSFNLGAARLLERFEPSDPITEREETEIRGFLGQQLQPVFDAVKKYPPKELIGSSGAFDSVIEMINGELNGEPLINSKTGYEIEPAKYRRISTLVKINH
jgi:exopolyphosphatase/guanosine-5'-triphosphate,3'-diphosphate pyrophosphatase